MEFAEFKREATKTIDMFVIERSGKWAIDSFRSKIDSKEIREFRYFLPHYTNPLLHKHINEFGSLDRNDINPKNTAMIVDDWIYHGNTIKTCTLYLSELGYSLDKMYIFALNHNGRLMQILNGKKPTALFERATELAWLDMAKPRIEV